MGKSLDPLKLAEELYWKEEARKVILIVARKVPLKGARKLL